MMIKIAVLYNKQILSSLSKNVFKFPLFAIVTKLGNICEELSPLNYRWRFSSSGPGSFIMISQHAITVSATGIYQ
jgi:hypothetical protein